MGHTPGPWIAEQEPFYDEDGGADLHYTGEFYRKNGDGTISYFDRLNKAPEIAAGLNGAGPELLTALESIAALLVPGPHASAKDGMAKALDALDEARATARAAITKDKSQ